MTSDPAADETDALFQVEPADSPWGDYGTILVHGMSAHLGRGETDGLIRLERTGPFVPPVTFPGISDVVVTDDLRRAIERSDLRGVAFAPVVLEQVVELRWESWDLSAKHPEEYPEGGEPEGYILDRANCPSTAAAIGPLWELVLGTGAELVRADVGPGRWDYEFRYVSGSLGDRDLFRVEENRQVYASVRARDWLLANVSDWVTITPVPQAT